jgi:hypothetical protein
MARCGASVEATKYEVGDLGARKPSVSANGNEVGVRHQLERSRSQEVRILGKEPLEPILSHMPIVFDGFREVFEHFAYDSAIPLNERDAADDLSVARTLLEAR